MGVGDPRVRLPKGCPLHVRIAPPPYAMEPGNHSATHIRDTWLQNLIG